MSRYKIKPLVPDRLDTYPLKTRRSKVSTADFAKVFTPRKTFSGFLDSLPDILAGRNLKELVDLAQRAKRLSRSLIWALGAHVIKVGLSPVLIDLMRRGWITGLALNGAGIIHDFEIAYAGLTSEDVGAQIKTGRFGMARETGDMLNEAINTAEEDVGLGEAVGRMIAGSNFAHKEHSLLAVAYDLRIPVTVHVALGTDIIHVHPKVNGEALGRASMRDFFLFCSLVKSLDGGGVFIHVGSAVILPEVFLKALSFVRNRGVRLDDFTTAVFDFLHHYRPDQNVVKRPLGKRGRGFYFIGHHEIMVPLLAAMLKSSPQG